MKWNLLLLLLISLSTISYGQTSVKGQIKDATTKENLPFCHIANQTTGKVSLSNEDGVFRIEIQSPDDQILITFIGYNNLIISAKDFPKNGLLYLTSSSIKIDEMVVVAEDAFLYKLVEKCRRKIRYDNEEKSSKTYLRVATIREKEPVEMIESYYNGFFKNATVDRLLLKNGRVGLTSIDSSAFVSLGTTQALAKLNLTQNNKNYPDLPLQFSGKKLKKRFTLRRLSNDTQNKVVHFAFKPRALFFKKEKTQRSEELFEGEIWIHQETYALLKIILRKKQVKKHPFKPIHQGSKIANVDLEITHNFNFDGENSLLSHINLDYNLTFLHQTKNNSGYRTMNLRTESLLHFYDYKNLFILPYYDYLATHNDYRKISIAPPNEVFWENNTGMVFSKKEAERLAFLKEEGVLLNFNEDFNGKPFFEHNNIFWSKNRRISALKIPVRATKAVRTDNINNARNIYAMTRVQNAEVFQEPFFVDIQLFMDINQVADTLHYSTATILDIFGTYNNLSQSDTMSCMVNILFDLCEMERRKLEQSLKSRNFTPKEADKVYNKSKEKLHLLIQKYLKDVFIYNIFDVKKMIEWNKEVKKELDIDNIKIFELQPVKKDEID